MVTAQVDRTSSPQRNLPRPGIALVYCVPPKDFQAGHYVKPGYFGMAMVLRQPLPPTSTQVTIWNVGEAVPHVFSALCEMSKSPSAGQVTDWSDRFVQSIFKSCEIIGKIRTLVQSGCEPSSSTHIKDDKDISELGRSLAEACELASYLIAIGGTISMDVTGVETFLKEPIAVENSGSEAIENSKRIAVRYVAASLIAGEKDKRGAESPEYLIQANNGSTVTLHSNVTNAGDSAIVTSATGDISSVTTTSPGAVKGKRDYNRVDRILAFIFGFVFVAALLVIALAFPNPSSFQYMIFKSILAVALAGVAVVIPGSLDFKIGKWTRATGAIAVFSIAYFKSPAALVSNPPASAPMHIPKIDGTTAVGN